MMNIPSPKTIIERQKELYNKEKQIAINRFKIELSKVKKQLVRDLLDIGMYGTHGTGISEKVYIPEYLSLYKAEEMIKEFVFNDFIEKGYNIEIDSSPTREYLYISVSWRDYNG